MTQTAPAVPPGATLAEEELLARLRWFIRHRWIAAASVCLVAFAASVWLHIDLPLEAVAAIALSIAAYNVLFDLFVRIVEGKKGAARLKAVVAKRQRRAKRSHRQYLRAKTIILKKALMEK